LKLESQKRNNRQPAIKHFASSKPFLAHPTSGCLATALHINNCDKYSVLRAFFLTSGSQFDIISHIDEKRLIINEIGKQ
jgi:hypothetical protein